MAGAWNEGDWGLGNFGEQNNITVPVTSVVDASIAWNAGNFGSNTWGGQFDNVGITLGDETTAGEIREGWGNFTWGSVPWGGEQDPEANVTGQQLNLSLGSLSFVITGSVELTGQQLGITTGTAEGSSTFAADVTGQQLNISLNSVTPIANANVNLTGQQLNVAEGEVDPSPDADVTGIGMTVALAVGTVVVGEGNVSLTGNQINISQGTVVGDANTIAEVSSIAQVGWGVVAWGTQAWNDSEVDITMAIAEGKVELHLFTVESPKALMRSLKAFIDKIVGSGIEYVYGRADNKEILRMLKMLGVEVEESDMKPYNWKAEVWEQ